MALADRLTTIEAAIRAVLDGLALPRTDKYGTLTGQPVIWRKHSGPAHDLPCDGEREIATVRYRYPQYGRPGQPINSPDACMTTSRERFTVWEARLVRCVTRDSKGIATPGTEWIVDRLRADSAAVTDALDTAVFGSASTLSTGGRLAWFSMSDEDNDGVPFDGFTVEIQVPV